MTILESEPSQVGVQIVTVSSTEVVAAENLVKKVSSPKHPPYLDMIVEAVKNVKSGCGASLWAIKKYMKDTYHLEKPRTYFIHKAINAAVEKETLVRVSGRGASGSFKLGKPEKKRKTASISPKTDDNAGTLSEATNEKAASVKVTKKGSNAGQKEVANKEKVQKKPSKASTKKESKTSVKPSAKSSKAEKTNLQAGGQSLPFEKLVVEAVRCLKNGSGSSLQVIKKYLKDTHQVNVQECSRFITKAINSAVQNGTLVRISGRGAAGTFKEGKTADSKGQAESPQADSEENSTPSSSEQAPNSVEVQATKNVKPPAFFANCLTMIVIFFAPIFIPLHI